MKTGWGRCPGSDASGGGVVADGKSVAGSLWVLVLLGFGCLGDGVTGKGAGERGVVSVMTFNTGDLGGHPQPTTVEIAGSIEAESVPDVLLLQEIYGEKQAGELARALGRELIDWLDRRGNPRVIVGGDFNTIPFSRAVRTMGSRFRDTLWPFLQYLGGTYRRLSFPVSPRIDYLFYGQGLTCMSSRIGRHSAGDHYPVLAEFEAKD
ncbi:MAG: endonuclease/exonuclease/phosphatase family protein [Desulfobacteraceae bacterium]|nr:endonuclease/exonuclease/phosphatase family protein [Desulfobacteraceae bacterium]